MLSRGLRSWGLGWGIGLWPLVAWIGCVSSSDGGAPSTTMDSGTVDEVLAPFQLSGAIQKGPFVLGSSVQITALDDAGNPTGNVFPSKTIDDLGSFALTVSPQSPRPLAFEASGFYYNEATSKLSDAALTLRAFYDLRNGGNQSAYINIVTHLTYDRVLTLVKGPPTASFSAAIAQAEKELQSSRRRVNEVGIGIGVCGGADHPGA